MECYGTSVVFRGFKQIWEGLEGYCCGCMLLIIVIIKIPTRSVVQVRTHAQKFFQKASVVSYGSSF